MRRGVSLLMVVVTLAGCIEAPSGCVIEAPPEPQPLRAGQPIPAYVHAAHPWFRDILDADHHTRSVTCDEGARFMADLAAAGITLDAEGHRAFVLHDNRTHEVILGRVVH